MNKTPPIKTVWPCLNCRDARAMIRFLTGVFGFEERLVVPGATGDQVAHAQLSWPEGGGVMLGSAGRDESPFSQHPTGAASIYVVTDRPDELFDRATEAGARLVRGLRSEDHGSRGFSVADPEGNLWSFGTYRGE
jgi:uncharacterized glyoxalase superfamily protein PhnB